MNPKLHLSFQTVEVDKRQKCTTWHNANKSLPIHLYGQHGKTSRCNRKNFSYHWTKYRERCAIFKWRNKGQTRPKNISSKLTSSLCYANGTELNSAQSRLQLPTRT